MGKPLNEIWKDVPYEEYASHYQISNWGNVRSKPRTYTRSNRYGSYQTHVNGQVLSTRTNGIEKHRFADLRKKTGEGKYIQKTAYVHNMVALAFKKHPKDKSKNKVTVKDGNWENIWPDNLVFVNQSYLSIKHMNEATDERRNWIGNYQQRNRKSSYDIKKFKEMIKNNIPVHEASIKLGYSASWGYYHL